MSTKKALSTLITLTCITFAGNLMAQGVDYIRYWNHEEANESFMRSLSKDQCMQRMIGSLKAGCSSESCLKTLAAITGDCITYASGSRNDFCSTYDKEYISKYCATNDLDARSCMMLHVGKSVACKNLNK
jgi:hypothetical protein